MLWIYSIGLTCYQCAIALASFFNRKAKAWVDGRKHVFRHIEQNIKNDAVKKIWFHCSSFGEFEQGRPVLQKLKHDFPSYKIVLTFFSPSGYAQGFKEPAADYVLYLPMDGRSNASRFCSLIKPALAVFVKYDFWFFYMDELAKRKIPIIYISSNFRPDQYFFKWFGKPFLNKLKQATHFFVQTKSSMLLLQQHGILQVTVAGDTRFDRVKQLPSISFTDEKIEAFVKDAWVIVAGSTWQHDERILLSYIQKEKGLKLLLIPHEINNYAIQKVIANGNRTIVAYTQTDIAACKNARVMVIDSMGMLSKLYRFGSVAYIGGGFGNGIHNILEAAVYGLPVLFGPHYQKFNEAVQLIIQKTAWSFSTQKQFEEIMTKLITEDSMRMHSGNQNRKYVMENAGATEKISLFLKSILK